MHAHDRGHAHRAGERIGTAFFLNLFFALVEVAGGLWTNSLAVLSDALHDLGDSVALALTWHFSRVSERKGDETFTFGYRRFSLLGALVMSLVLFAGGFVVLFEAVPRLLSPETANARGMIYLSIGGILINGIAAIRLHGGRNLSERIITWHFVEDVLGWIAVLSAGIVMSLTKVRILDPVLSILVTLYVLWNVGRRLKDTLVILLQGVPDGLTIDRIDEIIRGVKGVRDAHHTHVWSQDGQRHVLTTHVVSDGTQSLCETAELRRNIRTALRPLGIVHATIEVECASDGDCSGIGDDCRPGPPRDAPE
jgi:cobalt-zinc-cadmium efflux system protein